MNGFWADGNWGAKQLTARGPLSAIDAELVQAAVEAWQSEFHGGPCCSSCIGDMEDGYGAGFDCCCHDGQTALENYDYDPKYPPINGKLPEVFEKWGPKTQKRYLARYKKILILEEDQ